MELIRPHGGVLREIVAGEEQAGEIRRELPYFPSLDLTPHQVWDIELLLNGGFSPLDGFMTEADYRGVLEEMRLADGMLWPIPIVLDVSEEYAATISRDSRIALRHPEGMVLAILTVSDQWRPDFRSEADLTYGTVDETHPAVFRLLHQTNPVFVGGSLEGLESPPHHTFKHLRHSPAELRAQFGRRGWSNIVAFQTRNPMHRAHVELTKRAAAETGASLLIHPVVGPTKPGDVDYFVRVQCYKAALNHYSEESTFLSLLPLAMRMGGPREALWHGIIRKNYGCSHMIIGRDHAGPGVDRSGTPFYPPYAAQEIFQRHQQELGIQMVGFEEMVYVQDQDRYMPLSEVPKQAKALSVSGTELRQRLQEGSEVPAWFSYPEIMAELRLAYPPRAEQGFTIFFTGLSGSGKSTIANVLLDKLVEIGSRPVTLLDGDVVRKHLSSELGFSKEHRDLNIRRIGFVANEITKNRGVAICAPIAPYTAARREVREMIEQSGGFVEVYVATPLEVCEARDRKGLYAQARAGIVKNFTGISDPYKPPEAPEVLLDTSELSPEEAAERILVHLGHKGFIDYEGN